MKASFLSPLLTLLALPALAVSTSADGRNPGSVLVYPIHRSSPDSFTIVSVTNTNTEPADFGQAGGTTNVLFEYVNTVANPIEPNKPLDCFIFDRLETLTPADTLSVLTACHNAASAEGYVVVTATDPLVVDGKQPWVWNRLVGSALVATALGGVYSTNAIPFAALGDKGGNGTGPDGPPGAEKSPADLDGDGQLDFDGAEYEALPEMLILDSFLAEVPSYLTLINLTGGAQFTAYIRLEIWNDNEFPLSTTAAFRCWMEAELGDVSPVLDADFFSSNLPNDPVEVDLNCDGNGDFESGWAYIDGIVANSVAQSLPNPALLGSITAGPHGLINGGRLLWETPELQTNGDFLNIGSVDPEF